MIDWAILLALVTRIANVAIPYVLAALGGAVTERSGVIDLALEAKLLFGAFAAAAVGHATDCVVAGIAAGVAAGVAVAAIQLWLALILEADQVIVGVGLNLLALGGTRFLLQLFYGQSANSPEPPSYATAILVNPLLWLAVIATVAVTWAMRHARWGLRLRAAGDRPEALVSVGVSPIRARFAAGLVGGGLAGLGGVHLALPVGGFVADVSSGRGYIALAMVILAGWKPMWAVIACVVLAAAHTLGNQLQSAGFVSVLAHVLPYLLTLVVLVVAGGKGRPPPAALGKP